MRVTPSVSDAGALELDALRMPIEHPTPMKTAAVLSSAAPGYL
jgi:hypothetical protein